PLRRTRTGFGSSCPGLGLPWEAQRRGHPALSRGRTWPGRDPQQPQDPGTRQ
ncbi:hypothetical protein P7K49_032408, partial [Saguinus oedipus]